MSSIILSLIFRYFNTYLQKCAEVGQMPWLSTMERNDIFQKKKDKIHLIWLTHVLIKKYNFCKEVHNLHR